MDEILFFPRIALLMLLVAFSANPPLSGQEHGKTDPVTVRGEVLDRNTAQPLENVVIRIRELGLQLLTDSIGQFRLDDVTPGTYRMTLTRQGYLPEEVDFSVVRAGTFQISLSPREMQEDVSPSRIIGRVLARESREGLEAANVTLVGTPLQRATDPGGGFEFQEVPTGHYLLRVELLGRGIVQDSVLVRQDQSLEVEILLPINPIPLEGFTVTAYSKWLVTSGFLFRRKRGGFDGRQWDRAALEALQPTILRDALETVLGVNQAGTRGYVSWGRCKMTVFVDGIEMDGWYDLDMISPDRVEAMEVFNGRGISMPIEFGSYCGVILIWLKH